MKKRMVWRIVMAVLPLLTLGLAAMPDSVTAAISQTSIVKQSFFQPLPDGSYPTGLALGAMLMLVVFVLAVCYGIWQKKSLLAGMQYISLAAMVLGELPLILRGTPLVIPTPLFSLLAGAEFVLVFFYNRMLQKQPQEEKPRANRLDPH